MTDQLTQTRAPVWMGAALLCMAAAPLAASPAGAVRVTESDGVVMHIERDVASVVIADPGIADVQMLSDRTVFLFGKTSGSTSLYILDAENDIITEQRVFVTRSLRRLEETVRATPAVAPAE